MVRILSSFGIFELQTWLTQESKKYQQNELLHSIQLENLSINSSIYFFYTKLNSRSKTCTRICFQQNNLSIYRWNYQLNFVSIYFVIVALNASIIYCIWIATNDPNDANYLNFIERSIKTSRLTSASLENFCK